MKKLNITNIFLTFFGLTQASNLQYNQQNLVFRNYALNLVQDVFDNLGYGANTTATEDVASHGCWCAKLDPFHGNLTMLGGSTPLDELDEICENWFKTRHCNDRLPGGSCNALGTISKELLLAGEYNMDWDLDDQNKQINSCTCSSGGDNCSADTCIIDRYFSTKIVEFYIENEGQFDPIVLTSESDYQMCTHKAVPKTDRFCNGTAPHLSAEKAVCYCSHGLAPTGNVCAPGGLYYDVADDVCLICNPGYELTNENKCIYTAEYWTVEFYVLNTNQHTQSSCTPRVVINFVDPNITPIIFSGYSITSTKGIWTTTNTITRNFVNDLDEVDYFAIIPECNDAWVGSIRVNTPLGTYDLQIDGSRIFWVDGDGDPLNWPENAYPGCPHMQTCIAGFDESENIYCTCNNGFPHIGEDCPQEGSLSCQSCFPGFSMSNGQCV